jgi:DnaK suppressor protein
MTHLSPDQLGDFRAEIERQITKLEKSMAVSDEATATVQLDQAVVGRLSRMDSLQNQSMAENLAERERARHAQLRAALERIEAGTYGVCEDCDGPIAPGRLFVFPETVTCGGCQ